MPLSRESSKFGFPQTTVKEMAVKHAECKPTGFPPTGQG